MKENDFCFEEFDFDDLFSRFSDIFANPNSFNKGLPTCDPEFEVIPTDGDDLLFEVNVIGLSPETITVKSETGNIIRVTTKVEPGDSIFAKEYNTTFKVPEDYKSNSAKAVVSNGVLTISVSKRKSSKDKEIQVRY